MTFTAFKNAAGLRQNILVKKPRFTDKSLDADGLTETVWFKDWNDCLKYRKTPKKNISFTGAEDVIITMFDR